MILSDIFILANILSPYDIETNPSNVTISFLSAIIHSPYLQKEIRNLREEYNIPPEGTPFDQYLASAESNLYQLMEYELKYLLAYYDIPFSFKYSFYLLIAFNAFINITKDDYPDIYYAQNASEISEIINDAEEKIYNVGAITFTHRLEKQQIKDWLDSNWESIRKSMDEYLPSFLIEGDKFTNIEIADKILDLSNKGLTTEEISEEMSKLYPDHTEDITDPGWIKNKLSRYKKRINRFNKKYETLHSPEED